MKISRGLSFIFLFFALVGFLDATYLTAQHFLGKVPPCLVTEGCSTVLTSKWSEIMGVPVSLIGAIYYVVILLLTIAFLSSGKKIFLALAIYGTWVGFAASIWFVGLQVFVIKDICFYCMISAFSSTLLFITGLILLKKSKKISSKNLLI